MQYTNQQFFCNNCGKECITTPDKMIGGLILRWRVCSTTCSEQIKIKEASSYLNVNEYNPRDVK